MKTKDDINRRKDEATKSAEAFKKMEEAKVKYTAVSSQANNPNFLKLQNAYNTARSAFESTEKSNLPYIKEFEIKKGDFTLVLLPYIVVDAEALSERGDGDARGVAEELVGDVCGAANVRLAQSLRRNFLVTLGIRPRGTLQARRKQRHRFQHLLHYAEEGRAA